MYNYIQNPKTWAALKIRSVFWNNFLFIQLTTELLSVNCSLKLIFPIVYNFNNPSFRIIIFSATTMPVIFKWCLRDHLTSLKVLITIFYRNQ